jgi:DNA-directed RNA polymerase delta subunit
LGRTANERAIEGESNEIMARAPKDAWSLKFADIMTAIVKGKGVNAEEINNRTQQLSQLIDCYNRPG